MYISELDLHGFKSFAHKTKVKFDSGITAIVGPNGCGKSNIVDALRWVLGEQRPSLLRSASMSNVIFNGTSTKKALGMAEVSLTLMNNKGVLPTEYSEVTITRRLYRSGESDYLLNNTSCRLKDIMELFMDTGMGSDAYSVIELKMVEEILNDRNNDRRRLFEEAAGVTRYKDKRKQTLRKLDETMKDLQRIEDILSEVRKKTRSLEIQAEKAATVKNLRTELETLDKAYNRHEYLGIQEELKPLQVRIRNSEKEKREITSGLQKIEEQEELSRQSLLEKEKAEAEARRKTAHLMGSIREMETSLRINKEKILNENSIIEQYGTDIEQAIKDLKELKSLREKSVNMHENFSSELDRSTVGLKESKERFTDVQQQYTKERHKLYELEIETSNAEKNLNSLDTERVRLESRLENTGDDLGRIHSDISKLENQLKDLDSEKKRAEDRLEQLGKQHEEWKIRLHEAAEQKKQYEAEREQLREDIRRLRSRKESLQSETGLIEELAASKEFFPSSVAYLMEHHSDSFHLLTLVGNVFHTSEEHAAALDAALGEAINYVIVANMEEAAQAGRLLTQQEQGRATFIPLDELKEDYPAEKHSILSIVEVEEGYTPLARLLLGSVLLVQDIHQARRLLESGGSAAVTLEGEMVTSNRFLRSGSKNRQAGARLGLKDKLEKLASSLENVTAELLLKEKTLGKTEQILSRLDLEKLRAGYSESEHEIRSCESQIKRIESNSNVYQGNITDLETRREKLTSSEGTAREELKKMGPVRDELLEKMDQLKRQQVEKNEYLQKLEEERAIAQNRYNDSQLKHQDLKNKAENLERDIKRAESGIKNMQQRQESREELTSQSHQKINRYREENHETTEKLAKQEGMKKEVTAELKKSEEESSRKRGEIRELEKELKELRRRKEVNLELIHHLTMAKEKFEMQSQALSDHIWEQYGQLMKQVEEELPAEMDPELAKARIGTLRQQLNRVGEVNPLAIEEFEEEKKRLIFLEEQVLDLQEAESRMRETISEINRTATERFNKTFEQIRQNFKKVFSTLFQEDDFCDLLIEQDVEDPLEAKIEIKANPRGKRPSGISQLSGGEKTLTAIALLFAIYQVKPSPFCVLDEVDAPLDDANIDRFATMIRNFSAETQFIIITHNKKTMSKAEMMYGVTMPETGVSRVVGVRMDEVAA